MKKFGGWKKILEMGDALIDASETVHENLKGKSASEISDMIKKNVKGLNNPEVTKELKKIFVGRSFEEIKDTLQEYKGLSGKDAAEIAKSLSKDEGLTELMANKLKATANTQKEKRKEETIEKLNQDRAAKKAQIGLENKASNSNKKEKKPTELAKKISMVEDIGGLFFKKAKKESGEKPTDKKIEQKKIDKKSVQNNSKKKPGGDFKSP